MLLPVLMLLFALLLQPVCLLYAQVVMAGAAAEAARVVGVSGSEQDARALALRRLMAVPEASLFHTGGRGDWQVEFPAVPEGCASVRIVGHARPLPLFGAVVALLGASDARGVVLKVEVTERVRQTWLEGDYGSWMESW